MKEIDEDRDWDGKSGTVEKDVKNSPGRRLRDTAADLCLHVRRWHKVHTHTSCQSVGVQSPGNGTNARLRLTSVERTG